MNIRNIIFALIFAFACLPVLSAENQAAQTKTPVVQEKVEQIGTTPLEVAGNPSKFLNKVVLMDGKFDKFTTLGLDYKKAFKDSSEYIGFLVQRDDIKDHNVPLSELKLFMKRSYAEKFIDLNTGDKISIKGTVFSNALGDGWVEVDNIQVLEKAKNNQE